MTKYEDRCPILFHPDYTVGSGISPDLLTFPLYRKKRSRAPRKIRDTAGGELHPALRISSLIL